MLLVMLCAQAVEGLLHGVEQSIQGSLLTAETLCNFVLSLLYALLMKCWDWPCCCLLGDWIIQLAHRAQLLLQLQESNNMMVDALLQV